MGLAAPRSTPFQPPPATPLALVFAWTSLWPGQFLGKTDACHKPLGNRHHAHPSGKACTRGRLARCYVSGRSASTARSFGLSWKLEAYARSSLPRQAAFFSTRDNSPRSPARCDALGRRAAEGVPDSRAEAKGLGSAQRGERPVRGRRHLVVISQVKRQSRQKGECPGGLRANGITRCLSSSPARMRGKADFRQKIQDSGNHFL